MTVADINIKASILMKRYLNIFLDLAKIRITFFVAVSTSVGYILASGSLIPQMLLPTLGVFLLASGSSAFNHFQERNYDAMMNRTKNRPIPAGDIDASSAFVYAAVLTLTGSAVIYLSANLTALILGLIALVWYNLIYTPLKRVNSLAVIPGSVIGAIPPVIGWAATGRGIFEVEILTLALFFFIWQIPHFWLLLLLFGEDYEKAGFPTLTQVFNKQQLSRITYIWILGLAISGLLIPLFDLSASYFTGAVLLISGGYIAYRTRNILNNFTDRLVIRNAFMIINVYVLFVVIILTIDKLILTEI